MKTIIIITAAKGANLCAVKKTILSQLGKMNCETETEIPAITYNYGITKEQSDKLSDMLGEYKLIFIIVKDEKFLDKHSDGNCRLFI